MLCMQTAWSVACLEFQRGSYDVTKEPFDRLPTKLPLSDKARGNLKRELELMPKMSFARNATSEQKEERARAVEALLEADLSARHSDRSR